MQTLQQLKDGDLIGATSLKLSENLDHFPPEIFTLEDTLEVLDLSFNSLTSLPADFGRLKKLKIFFCSENLFTELPEVLADCPLLDIVGFKSNKITTVPAKSLNKNLRWLILTNNKISELPAQIGYCLRMQKLMLAGNRLKILPEGLNKCTNLGLLRISANLLSELPGWLLSMPKLSWLAYSGNPFSTSPKIKTIPLIDWTALEIKDLLGQGASGVIYQAAWQNDSGRKEIAVKLFKGAMTSDGLPEDEMNTCIAAGDHPGLVPIIGKITRHPEDKQGLVMELIPNSFYNLGNPPSFQSCTRDVFHPDTKLTVLQVLKIAGTIASVANQLHQKGIMHGDLYAHNILVNQEGNTLFGDFGAACFYDRSNYNTAFNLERLEVSAFGYLLDDLLSLCEESNSNEDLMALGGLRDSCINAALKSRPSFSELISQIIIPS
jgi:predicted Ser/Thr protein kinase